METQSNSLSFTNSAGIHAQEYVPGKDPIESLQWDNYLSESLAMAKSSLARGKANEAVELTGEALLYLLRKGLPLTHDNLERLKALPRIGIELVQNGKNLKLIYHKPGFHFLEASTFRHLLYGLLESAEKTSVWNQWTRSCRVVVVCALDKIRDWYCVDIHGVERLRLCRIISLLKQAVAPRPAGYGNYLSNHCLQLSVLLREPLQRSAKIVKSNVAEMELLEHRRNRRRSYQEICQHRKLFLWRRKQEYLARLNASKRSRLVAAFHFGDFVHALNYFTDHSAADRQSLVLRQQEASTNNRANTAVEFAGRRLRQVSQLLSHQTDPLLLVASLRRGNTSLIIFCDLPREYGQVVEVNFLGRQAWFPKGPAQIALVSKAPLLPFITYNDGQRNIIHTDSLIEPDMKLGESFQQATQRLTQILVSFLETHLRRYPDQWRYLSKLPSYFAHHCDTDASQPQ